MSKIIDIHCHHKIDDPKIIEILVADTESLFLSPPLTEGPICVGLHPWQIDNVSYERFNTLFKKYLNHPDFFALGEIGLDKACETMFDKQIEVFNKQLVTATSLKIPRIVIHSVKAHSEILNSLKVNKVKSKLLIHDFYGNIETAKQYLRFDSFFSFGHKLFKNSNAQKVISELPIHRIFLETDDQLDYNIFEVYDQAAKLLNLDLQTLKDQLFKNYQMFSAE